MELSPLLTISISGSGKVGTQDEESFGGGNIWIPTGETVSVELTAVPDSGYHFVNWQTSTDGETWDDIPGATSTTYTVSMSQAGDYYIKAIFEQD